MPSEPRPRGGRLARRIGVGLAAFIAVVLAVAGWLLATESGARAVFSLIEALPGSPLQASGVHGRIAGPLRVDRLAVDTAGQSVTLRAVELDWAPRALLDTELHITSLRIGHFDVRLKEQAHKEPAQLPDTIALPLRLRVDKARLDGGEIRQAESTLVNLGETGFNLEFDGARYRFVLERLALRSTKDAATVAASLKGEATLATAKPYALQARLASGGEAMVQEQKLGASGEIRVGGSLEEMKVASDFTVNRARLVGNVVLRPFSPQPLGAADLAAQAVDLSAFRAGLPQTGLDLKLFIDERGSGKLAATNSEAGLVGDQRLPLADLRIVFRQEGPQIRFDRIAATLGSSRQPAGVVEGTGSYADGALAIDLSTRSLDLQRIDRRARPTRLAGDVGLRHAAGRQELTVALTEPLKRQKLVLNAHAVLANDIMRLERATLEVGGGRVEASGQAGLAGDQVFSASGRISRFRPKDLGDFPQLPDALLNGRFELSGARKPQLSADLSFDIGDSRIGGQPLLGEGRLRLRADSVDVSKLLLMAGANRLNVEGSLSQRGGELSVKVDAPKLDQLGRDFSGVLHATGTARGSFTAPRIEAQWTGANLRLAGRLQADTLKGSADVRIDRSRPLLLNAATLDVAVTGLRAGERQLDSLTAKAQFAPQPDAPLQIAVRAEGIRAGGLRADRLTVDASGVTARHEIQAVLTEPGQSWTLGASGGLSELGRAPQWQGSIRSFDAAGRFVASLAAQAPLLVSQQRVQLDQLRVESPVGLFTVKQFLRDGKGIITRGQAERVQLAQLLRFAGKAPAVTTDLQLSGEWDLNLTDSLGGTVRLRRDGGDIVMQGSVPVALGLRQLEADLSASGGQTTLKLRAEGKQVGRIEASGRAGASGGGGFGLSPDAPVSGEVRIDIPSLGWVGALASPTLLAEGRMRGEISVGGTVSQPRLAGQINGSDLRLLFTDTGVDLRQGTLESEFRDSQLVIKALRFGSPDGQLVASGQVDLAGQPSAQVSIRAERFALFDRTDRRLRISGESQVGWKQGAAKVTGEFTVDSGFIDIGSTSMPKLSDDVVIVGRGETKTEAKTKASQRGLPAAINVTIRLGKGVRLRGRGLDGLLVGEIRLLNAQGEPLRALGSLQIEKGTFSAYGRELAIEKGVLRFNGPLDNPQLDIVAMRRGQEVEAGVSVAGTVLAPRIALVSEPPVAEAEKLSWLVLGRGLATAGEGDVGALQGAAASLLSQGAAAGVSAQIARAFGLDEFSIGSTRDTLQERIVTLGKQISSKLYVSFERGLETASNVLHVRYTLSPKLTLEAQAGTRSALSLFYNLSFD